MKTLLFLLFTLITVLPGNAIEIKTGEYVTISKPINGDLYVSGGTVVINAPIYGDLIVSGGNVTLNDSVAFDLIAAGGELFINGYVRDDIRCAGGRIHLSGNIGGDVVVAGGTISIDRSVTIAGSLMMGAGEVILDGTVEGQLKAGVGTFVLNGTVQKEADVRGGKIEVNGKILGKSSLAATDIQIGDDAEFGDDVRYWNESGELSFKQSVKKGTSTYDSSMEMETGRWHYLGFATIVALLLYLGAAFLMMALMQYFFGATFRKASGVVLNESLKSLGMGALFVVAVPVVIVVSFITVIGIPLGFILLAVYLFAFMLATGITSVVVSNWINRVYYGSRWTTARVMLTSFLVFVILKLFSLTPFVGFLITALLVCMAWGAILMSVNWKRQDTVTPA